MPKEALIVAIFALSCGTAVLVTFITAIARHYRMKLQNQGGGGRDASLTASELSRIVEQAVAQATQPLADRIETLESTLRHPAPGHPALPEARTDALFESLDSEPADMAGARPRSRA